MKYSLKFCNRQFVFQGILASLLIFVSMPACFAAPGTTNAPSGSDFSSFSLITTRNIFNPRRSARYTPARNENRRVSRVESFALVGTMSYGKGPFAFFDGNSSDYRKALKPDDSIAGYKITDIGPSSVKLKSSTNEVELVVGNQLSREEGGDWHPSARQEPSTSATERNLTTRRQISLNSTNEGDELSFPPPGPDGGSTVIVLDPESGPTVLAPGPQNDSTNSIPGVAAGSPESDVLRRLMQRREQENNR